MQEETKTHAIRFTGEGTEYAKIFFMNILLSILTLGIYSAWAKVRNKKYFYGNTILDDSSYQYHATGKQVLIGRLIAIGLLIAFQVLSGILPAAGLVLLLVLFIALPIIIIRSMRFNLRMSSYRQIRFNFIGQYFSVLGYYFVLPVLSMFTLYLGLPYAIYKQTKYTLDQTKYGSSHFEFQGKASEFFMAYLIGFLLMLGAMILIGLTMSLFMPSLAGLTAGAEIDMATISGLILPMYAGLFLSSILFIAYIKSRIMNHVFNNLHLDNVRFSSEVEFSKLLGIMTTNILFIVLSFGIFIPWAKVRSAKYILSCITVHSDNLGAFVQAEKEKISAFGEEFGEAMDIDISIV